MTESKEPDPLIGMVLDGKYRLDRILGIGGMATVYAATRLQFGDTVAIKVLSAEAMQQHQAVKRFEREARAVASIKHPNVISVYDFGALPDERAYMVMEYIRGESLREELKANGRLTSERAVQVMRAVCAAVQAAHEEGVIHRDLKPENVMLARHRDGTEIVKVVDFGVAELHESAAASAMTKLTEVGLMVGTPHYMSPEQCRSETLDKRSDVYSLGIILYELLTGTVPFNARTVSAVIIQHATEPPRRLRDLSPDIPWSLEQVVLRALEKDRSRRPQSAAELSQNLQMAFDSLQAQTNQTLISQQPPTRELRAPTTFPTLPPVSFETEVRDTPPRPLRRGLTGYLRVPGGTTDSGFVRRPTGFRRTASLHFDSLTGIYNTTYLSQRIDETLVESKKVTVLMLGIDQFGQINNSYGYRAGDLLLRELASWLRDQVGDQGIVSRAGSDEFLILVADQAIEETLGLAQALQQEITSHVFLKSEVSEGVPLKVTIAVVTSPEDGTTPQDLLDAASRALSQAKQSHHGGVYRLGEEGDDRSTARLNFNAFVGRARELRQLSDAFDRTMRGRTKPVLIQGPTGLGKTRLTKEFRRRMAGKEVTFLSGAFFEAGQGAPYKTFYDSLRGPIQALLEIENGQQAEAVFGTLTDRVFQDFGSDEGFMYFCDLVQVENAHEKYLTFEYLTNLFLILAQQKPVVLFLDDLHWSDELSFELLAYLARAATGQRLMVIGAARSEGVTDRHPLRNWIRTLNQSVGCEILTLDPLSQDDTLSLLRSIFTNLRISPLAVSHLYVETKGNPYFLCEIVRYLVQEGRIVRRNDSWECGELDDIVLPQSVVDVVEAGLSRVSGEALDIFAQASAIGQEFTFDLLQLVTNRTERELLDAIEAGLAQQVISEIEDRDDDAYRFYHGTVQKVLYARLNRRRRRSLHTQVGQALEQQYSTSGQTGRVLAQLAYHFYNGGEFQQTLQYAVAAGIQAWRAWAGGDARRFFSWAEEAERKLNLVPEVGGEEGASFEKVSPTQLKQLVDLNLNYGHLLISFGQLEDAEKKLQLALALTRHLNDELLRGRTLGALGELCEARSEYALSLLYCRQALEILRRGGDTKAESRTLCTIGMVYDRLGQLARSAESQEKSLALSRSIKDRMGESMALRELAYVLIKQGQYRRAVECAQSASEIAQQMNDRLGYSISLNILGVAYLAQNRPDRAHELFQESLKAAAELNRPRGEAIELANLGECQRVLGDFGKSMDLNQQALALSRQIGSKQLEATALFFLGRTYQSRHEHEQALDYFQQAAKLISSISDRILECDVLLGIAEIYLSQSRPSDAMESIQSVLTTTADFRALPWRWRALFVQGRCQFFLGQTKEAQQSLSEAVEIVKQLGNQLSSDVPQSVYFEDKKPLSRALESVLIAVKNLG
ncbi:MAG TPA: protein kinase [Acidobacteriota bacterium]|nr:protein kinase [Acidobacteriota bacterium]